MHYSIRRIFSFLVGVVMILTAFFIWDNPYIGQILVAFFILVGFLIKGIKALVYYFSLARYKIGGISVLYRGLLFINLSLFTLSLHSIPVEYAMIYIIVVTAASGAVDFLRALEVKRTSDKRWILKMIPGILQVVLSLACLFMMNSPDMLVSVYGLSLIFSGIGRIIKAFRRAAVLYVG